MLVPEQNYLETQLGKSYYYSVFVHTIMDNDVFNVNSRPKYYLPIQTYIL